MISVTQPTNERTAGSLDPELLERLLNQHAAALELFARQWTPAPEDCVQEAFLELVRQRPTPDNITAWLYRVVRNRAISASRSSRRRRKHEAAAALESRGWFAPARVELVDEETLSRALSLLADQHREVIVARIWGGLSFEQISEVVGTSVSSAHRRYHAGLRELRERLGISWLTNKTTPAN